MDRQHLFLYSFLKDSGIEEDVQQQLLNKLELKLEDLVSYKNTIDKAGTLVSFENGDIGEHSIENLLEFSGKNEVLSINENVFTSNNEDEDSQWSKFENAILNIPIKDTLEQFNKALFYCFKRYAWCLPAPESKFSLFEYAKSRTAFAQCLATTGVNQAKPFLILCGDISGIQSFIYDIHSRRAAKSLKGRSFYLQLLLDSIIYKILSETQIPITNTIYSSGGKFYILLPNTEDIKSELKRIEELIIENIHKEHGESLYVCLDWIEFGIKKEGNTYLIKCDEKTEEGNKNISELSELWKGVSSKAGRKKQVKFKELAKKQFNKFFRGELHQEYNGEGIAICAVTGIPTKKEYNLMGKDEDENIRNEAYVTKEVMEQVELGNGLKDALFYETTTKKREGWINPINLGVYHRLPKKGVSPSNYVDSFVINPTNDIEIHEKYTGFMFYGGNHQAVNEKGDIKDYSDLSFPDENNNFHKLGVLRMDIDNLGALFTNKMSGQNGVFAAYSALSSRLDWFFSGHLNSIRNHSDFQDNVNIVYAGGDDMFAVGRWDKIIAFGDEVRKQFRKFVGQDITLSGGIAIVNPKFPISKSAAMAGEALDEYAKKYKRLKQKEDGKEEADKDAIDLLNTTLSWTETFKESYTDNASEFDFVIKLAKEMKILLSEKNLSKGFLYKLFVFKDLKDKGELRWWWQSAYALARVEGDVKYNKNISNVEKEFIKKIKNAITTVRLVGQNYEFHTKSKGRMLDLICLAAQLADYYNR